ncbi:fimbria/pilus periplasmic chaperone [Providencia sp. PROV116]|uniref:fimbria/pilus periplasmic chaperone n=1 Tax=Providencia sp. PROV116 TaxID=2949827 RepID=UPI002349BF28|nr:fimbria/pilus periplasmic chaperone [Providencia sp. PROV116]
MQLNRASSVVFSLIGLTVLCSTAYGAISMDRTRVIFDGSQKSISLNISNNNKQLPYLAQGWIENAEGQKVQSPLVVLPPVQRLEPGKSSQVKIEALPTVSTLPQDRESLFYFNLREIPPKSDKPNTLQIALQTRVKLFYRPEAIIPEKNGVRWQDKLTLEKQGDQFIVKNPTPYYVTIINATANAKSSDGKEFMPVMVSPYGQDTLGVSVNKLGSSPVLTYINDFGGRPTLAFHCKSTTCDVVPNDKSE